MQDAPQELIDCIVAFASQDRKVLCAVRLVSRSWNISARVHLFRSLQLVISEPHNSKTSSSTVHHSQLHSHSALGPLGLRPSQPVFSAGQSYAPVERLRRTLHILETSPDVAPCIREVTVGNAQFDSSTTAPRLGSSSSSSSAASHGTTYQQEEVENYTLLLPSIFSYLQNISTLYLREVAWTTELREPPLQQSTTNPHLPFQPTSSSSSFFPPFGSSARGRSTGTEFLSCILRQCQSPQLQHLDVHNCQMPSMDALVDFLAFTNGVRSLRLSQLRILNLSLSLEPVPLAQLEGPLSHHHPTHIPSTSISNQDDPHSASSPLLAPGYLGPQNASAVVGSRFCSCPCSSDGRLPLGLEKQKQRRSLQNLTINTVPLGPVLYALLATTPCSIDLRQLRRLCLHHVSDRSSVRHFLQVAGGDLEYLELRFSSCAPGSPRSNTPGPDLSHLPRLRSFIVGGLQWTPSTSPVEGLVSLFENIKDPWYPLESVVIIVNAVKRKSLYTLDTNGADFATTHFNPNTSNSLFGPPPRKAAFDYTSWNALDDVLSRDSFSSLERVTIHLIVTHDGEVSPQRLLDEMPNLSMGPRKYGQRSRVEVICSGQAPF